MPTKKEPKTIIKEVTTGIRKDRGYLELYEEVKIKGRNRATFLTYSVNDMRTKFFMEGKIDYKGFFDVIDQYEELAENAFDIIKIIPEISPNWKLAEYPLPEIALTESELNQIIYDFLYEHGDLVDPLQYWIIVAWIKANWIPERWSSVPYLYFLGTKGSGKSAIQRCISAISFHPLLSCNISTPALYHSIEKWNPTIFLDEVENWDKDQLQTNTGILNSGYQKGQYAIRMIGEGANQEPKKFNVFGFKSIAGTQELKDTTMSRCIIINMFRSSRKLRLTIDEKVAQEIRNQLLIYRLTTLYKILKSEGSEGCEASEGCEGEEEELTQFENGRFIEKYNCLIKANQGFKDKILEFAKKEYAIELEEEASSEDAEVVSAIDQIKNEVENRWLSTHNITQAINLNKSDNEKWKSFFTGRILKRLGFKNKHTNSGNGILFDEKILKYNLMRFHLEDNCEDSEEKDDNGEKKKNEQAKSVEVIQIQGKDKDHSSLPSQPSPPSEPSQPSLFSSFETKALDDCKMALCSNCMTIIQEINSLIVIGEAFPGYVCERCGKQAVSVCQIEQKVGDERELG